MIITSRLTKAVVSVSSTLSEMRTNIVYIRRYLLSEGNRYRYRTK